MFTGIITDVGEILELEKRGDLRARIKTNYDTNGIAFGASIACDGICLTVVDFGDNWFDVEISAETVSKSVIGSGLWRINHQVNLERSLKVGDELGGHIVTGHIDGTGIISKIEDKFITVYCTGAKSSGIIDKSEIPATELENLAVNNEIEVYVERTEDRSGNIILSIEKARRAKSWKKINSVGKKIRKKWNALAKKHKIKIVIQGLNSLLSFHINSKNWLKYKTYISQELLKHKILSSNVFYPCISHNDQKLKLYFDALDKTIKNIALCEKKKLNIDNLLGQPVCQSGFGRLN